jgi:general L-amino acid transport system permease protein
MTDTSYQYVRDTEAPKLPAPNRTTGVVYWLQTNLFSSVSNTILTILTALFLIWLVPLIYNFFIGRAVFTGTMDDCRAESFGACWVFITSRASFMLYGFYPVDEYWKAATLALENPSWLQQFLYTAMQYWRPNLVFLLAIVLVIPLLMPKAPYKVANLIAVFVVFPIVAVILLVGGIFGLPRAPTETWGGLLLTLVLSVVGIVGSFPLGILLALGRRSNLPIIKTLCILTIELWRAVPLITVLFMASVMLPLFVPQGVTFDKVVRAMIAITIFQGAYMAETIRGGLQAMPRGQFEAASALGLNYWKSMIFIILPQALKYVIPGIVGNLISLVKDTSLVSIIGLFDLLNAINAAGSDTEWASPTKSFTGYAFAIMIFFVLCFALSRYAKYMEDRLNTGHKR